MSLNPERRPVPAVLVTPRFVLRRQREDDNAADHEAVMDSREALRVWSDSEWPEDGFTPDENAADLRMHIGEHDRDEAYGYSVFGADGERFLGSLYLNEVAPFLDRYRAAPDAEARLAARGARVEYWLRRGVDADFEVAFVRELRAWLDREWWFGPVVFGSRRGMDEQRRRYEAAGLTEIARLEAREGERRFHFHG